MLVLFRLRTGPPRKNMSILYLKALLLLSLLAHRIHADAEADPEAAAEPDPAAEPQPEADPDAGWTLTVLD